MQQPLADLLDFATAKVRDVELPLDPFDQERLLVSALTLDAELMGVCRRLTEIRWTVDPRYAEAKRPVVPVEEPPPDDPPPPPPPKDQL